MNARDLREHERPEQIKLFFYPERPQMEQERRSLDAHEIRVVVNDLPPISDVKQRCERVAPARRSRITRQAARYEQREREHREQRRQQASGSPLPEPSERNTARLVQLEQQQGADQVAAD